MNVYSEEAKAAFTEAYSTVFSEDGEILGGGREITMRLIRVADEIEPTAGHGDPNTGFMDVAAIRRLRDRILSDGRS